MFYSRWRGGEPPDNDDEGLSILDLIKLDTLDSRLAALLWLLMENRSSLLVAAGPSNVGKSTLLRALLDFLPPTFHQLLLQGDYEDFKFTSSATPATTYLVAEEIGVWGYAEYLKGLQALRAFELLPRGYALGATIHGRTAKEVVYVLNRMIGIPLDLVAHLGTIITLSVKAGKNWNDEPIRRINAVDVILGSGDKLTIQALAAARSGEAQFEYLPDEDLRGVLQKKGLIGKQKIEEEIVEKSEVLSGLLKKGVASRQEVRAAIRGYHSKRKAK
jgi:energy-coupling factor transporter ATP-binding protein EcfA2